jgi:hypothetical protein
MPMTGFRRWLISCCFLKVCKKRIFYLPLLHKKGLYLKAINMIFAESLRVTPLGLMLTTLTLLTAIYWTVGPESQEAAHPQTVPQTISLKALLTASVEMAKLGGHEVRLVRQQVRKN